MCRTIREFVMRNSIRSLCLCLSLLALSLQAGQFSLRGTTDKDVAIYAPGEKMVFTLVVYEDDKPVAGKKITWTRSGDDGKKDKGEGIADESGLQITTSMDQPGFVRIEAKVFDTDGKPLEGYVGGWGANKAGKIFFDGGACVEPQKLVAGGAEPADFDAFWKSMRETLDAVPVKAERTEVPSVNPKVKIYAVSIDCAGPKPVTGYLTIPAAAKPKSLPGICQFQGYGVHKQNAPTNGSETAIVLNINAHGMELGKDDAYYAQLVKDLKGYAFNKEENSEPKTAYFYGMALRLMRTFEYVKSLPEWDGKTLQSNGGSQGGLQGLWGAGLDPDVTSSEIWSPWCCDLGGINVGKLRGWRPDYTDALAYYDPVFFAKRIKAKVHLVANYGDYTCPPSGVWAVYNGIPGDNKAIEMRQGCTHGYTMPHYMAYTFTPEGVKNVGASKK